MEDGMAAIVVGVGSGLGVAIAKRFAAEGLPVGLVARSADRLAEFADKLARGGAAVGTQAADVADADALRAAIDQLSSRLGGPEVLVYNAAVARRAEPSALDEHTLAHDLAVDVIGALVAANHVAPGMIARGGGSILLTGGGFAERPWSKLASLGVGKAALRNLARSLAQEYGERGLHVATVTIHGMVADGAESLSPAAIAEVYAALHAEPRGAWRTEVDLHG